ncbi:hypothetical protein Sjap_015380 [Stephania japonica]|uniref:Uncharacterized protein n=1 Tax=Stephania japonica TaxID=461633 RepID=A0AAP0IK37_9MAGN
MGGAGRLESLSESQFLTGIQDARLNALKESINTKQGRNGVVLVKVLEFLASWDNVNITYGGAATKPNMILARQDIMTTQVVRISNLYNLINSNMKYLVYVFVGGGCTRPWWRGIRFRGDGEVISEWKTQKPNALKKIPQGAGHPGHHEILARVELMGPLMRCQA